MFQASPPLPKTAVASFLEPLAKQYGLGSGKFVWTSHDWIITKLAMQSACVVDHGNWQAELLKSPLNHQLEQFQLKLGYEFSSTLMNQFPHMLIEYGKYEANVKHGVLADFHTWPSIRSP